MRIFPADPDIGDEEGFAPSKDLFKRAELGAGMTNLLTKVSHPLVLAVDGQWGSGKTTFLKMWAGELRTLGFPVIFFDAFAHDHFDDAFSAIAHEIVALAETRHKADSPAGKQLIIRAVNVGKVLARGAFRFGVKAATAGIIDTADASKSFGDLAGDLIDETSSTADKLVDAYLDQHRKQVLLFNQFREALECLPAAFLPKESIGPAKPLVIIVDELDRCRPNFAVQLLERVKHFFSVDNVHFVLGVHVGQLKNSIKAAYGDGIDASVYLEKFINLTIPLIDTANDYSQRNITRYAARWTKNSGLEGADLDAAERATAVIVHVAEGHALGFRTIERILTNLAIALAFSRPRTFREGYLIGGLCVLKVTRPDLFAKAKAGTLGFTDLQPALIFDKQPSIRELRTPLTAAAKWWMHVTNGSPTSDFVDILERFGLDAPAAIPFLANHVIDRWKDPGERSA